MAHLERVLVGKLKGTSVVKVFSYVDDFSVLLNGADDLFSCDVAQTLEIFEERLTPLVVTHDLPHQSRLKFLDLCLTFSRAHVCWMYEPRSQKPLLPFMSAHTKFVKRAIISSCHYNALSKTCKHCMDRGFNAQVSRLTSAGYPQDMIVAVSDAIRRTQKNAAAAPLEDKQDDNQETTRPRKVAVIPYLHGISHNLKEIGAKTGVQVVMFTPEKLSKRCIDTSPFIPKKKNAA